MNQAKDTNKHMLSKILFCIGDSARYRKIALLAVLILIGSAMESLIMAGVYPFIGLMNNPNLVTEMKYISDFYHYIGSPDPMTTVSYLGLGLILGYVLKIIYQIWLYYVQCRFSFNLSGAITKKLFKAYIRSPYSFHLKTNSATLLRNVNQNVTALTTALRNIIILINEVTIVIGISVVLFWVEPVILLTQAAVILPLSILYTKIFKGTLKRSSETDQKASENVNKFLNQSFQGIKDVKILCKENYFEDQFSEEIDTRNKSRILASFLFATPRNFLEAAGLIGLLAGFFALVYMEYSTTQILQIIGIIVAASFKIIPSASRILASISELQFSAPPIDIIYKDLKTSIPPKPSLNEKDKTALAFETFSGKDLQFCYPGTKESVLKCLNFQIKKGESVGVVGSSGAGKTTLIDLILGLYRPTGGAFKLDGKELSPYYSTEWRKMIGYIPQKICIHDEDIIRNIAFGVPEDEVCMDSLKEAIELAQLNDLIDNLPNGLKTMLGEDGVMLSGGQKQRIGIARALYHKPEILVMDEATSALDNQTEQSFVTAIESIAGKKTMIIIAHRLTTIKNCDKIYFLKDGLIAGEGKFEELSSNNKEFRTCAALH